MSSSELVEEADILRAAQHNPDLFTPIYERYFPRIYGYCLRRVRNVQDAEDLTSYIFAHVLANLQQYRGGQVYAWLFRIAHNVVINYRNRQKVDLALDDVSDSADNSAAALIESLIEAQETQIISELVRQLPEVQQRALLLKIVSGMSSEEIGEALGKSAGAIRVMLHRTIQELYREYQHRQGE
ncbi:MAG TPA: sigma-70 family RNA polymerase sigma factor [Aggregatilineales bacterium]|nr:sigma-70 family RNA polymerase sigma factor [Aggregatilineales bacterium]